MVAGFGVYCYCCVSDTRRTRRASFGVCSSQCACVIYCKSTARSSCHCICIYSRCDIASLKGMYGTIRCAQGESHTMFMSTERVSQCFLQFKCSRYEAWRHEITAASDSSLALMVTHNWMNETHWGSNPFTYACPDRPSARGFHGSIKAHAGCYWSESVF